MSETIVIRDNGRALCPCGTLGTPVVERDFLTGDRISFEHGRETHVFRRGWPWWGEAVEALRELRP